MHSSLIHHPPTILRSCSLPYNSFEEHHTRHTFNASSNGSSFTQTSALVKTFNLAHPRPRHSTKMTRSGRQRSKNSSNCGRQLTAARQCCQADGTERLFDKTRLAHDHQQTVVSHVPIPRFLLSASTLAMFHSRHAYLGSHRHAVE